MAPAWPSSREVRTRASVCQRVEAPWPLALARRSSPDKKPRIRRFQNSEGNTGRIRGSKREMDGPVTGKTQGADMDMVVGQGRHMDVK